MPKYFVVMVNGEQFEVDLGTYNKLDHRVQTGRVNGWYQVHSGPCMGTSIQMPHVARIFIDYTEQDRKNIEKKRVEEKKARLAETKPKKDKLKCKVIHKMLDEGMAPEIEIRYADTERGTKQYRPYCNKCGWVGTLVKPAIIPRVWNFEKEGLTMEDVKILPVR